VKGIGVFVLLLLVGLGVTGYVVTRPPDRDLDAQGRAWVTKYEAWVGRTERRVDAASVGMGFSSERRNARLLEPLRACSVSFGRIGPPPTLLSSVQEAAAAACGQAEHAVRVNDRFGFASLATTKLHLDEAGDQLRLSRSNLQVRLGEPAGSDEL
jgi:hypothetical protein